MENLNHTKSSNKASENLNISGVINSKIRKTDGLLGRINKLVDFLDECYELKVSAGDVMGYICGYVDITSEPEDEIETFD
jgi:hypothetical protein